MSTLKDLRKKAGYTQKDLSEASGISLRTIQRLESTNKKPEGYTLKKLSETFDLDTADFLSKFEFIDNTSEIALRKIKIINLSILACLGLPFGNLIVPAILWNKWKEIELVNELGRRIVNLQIILTALMCFSLILSPFVGRLFQFSLALSPVLVALFSFLAIYVLTAFITAFFLQKKKTDILHFPIQLL